MPLGDALVICRQILIADPAVDGLVGGEVYSTPLLPPQHQYPLIRLTHIGQTGYAPVAFRHSALSQIQLDVWSYDQSDCAAIAEAALEALHGAPAVDGAISITPTYESREMDETVQPPLHRYRADLSVRVVRIQMAPL